MFLKSFFLQKWAYFAQGLRSGSGWCRSAPSTLCMRKFCRHQLPRTVKHVLFSVTRHLPLGSRPHQARSTAARQEHGQRQQRTQMFWHWNAFTQLELQSLTQHSWVQITQSCGRCQKVPKCFIRVDVWMENRLAATSRPSAIPPRPPLFTAPTANLTSKSEVSLSFRC